MNADAKKLTELSLQELMIEDGELQILKQRLGMEKQGLQSQLVDLNSRCATRLPQKEYQRLQSQRGQIVKQLNEKEQEIGEVNARRAELNTIISVRKKEGMRPSDIKQLVCLRDKWHGFSMDGGNHQKAREAAWKFSQELREILKHYFDSTALTESTV